MTRTEMLNPRWSTVKEQVDNQFFLKGRILVKDLEIVKQNVTLSTLRVCFTSSQMLRRRKT